jgi:hypothetical protein
VILPESDSARGICDVRIAGKEITSTYLQIASDPRSVTWTIP